MTTRINLLPWREDQKAERKKQFQFSLVVAAIVGVIIYGMGHLYYSGQISNQHHRNQLLQNEIRALDVQIAEIRALHATRDRLVEHMRVIEELQQGRSQIVHTFKELVTSLPEGVFLTSIRQSGGNLTLGGMAESNARISSFMENLDRSPWLTEPRLNVIQVKEIPTAGGRLQARVSDYVLLVKQDTPAADSEPSDQTPGS